MDRPPRADDSNGRPHALPPELPRGIARTAMLTAAARAVESERGDAIVRDPFARALAGDEGMRMLEAQADARPRAALAVRTRFLDDVIARAIADGVQQVVLLAAGLDARALRMNVPHETAWLEVDRAEVLAYKRAVLAEAGARANVAIADVAADVRDPALGAILAARGLVREERSVWIAEGLLPYLNEAEARALVASVAGACARGSVLAFDVPSRASLDPNGPLARHLAELAASGAPWKLGTDAPAGLVSPSFAADVVHVGHPRAHFGRLAAAPSEAPPAGAPITWLVTATRL